MDSAFHFLSCRFGAAESASVYMTQNRTAQK